MTVRGRRNSAPCPTTNSAPGVSVGERRQPFKLESGVRFPSGALGADSDGPPVSSHHQLAGAMMGTRVCDAVTVSPPCVWSSRWCVPSACNASAGVIARRTVSSPTARGDRRVGALLRQELAGSNPVGGTVHREHPGQREHEGALDTGPAPTVFRSPSLILWPSRRSHPSTQEPELRGRIPASCRAKSRQGSGVLFRWWYP